jgi:hypothetical protein
LIHTTHSKEVNNSKKDNFQTRMNLTCKFDSEGVERFYGGAGGNTIFEWFFVEADIFGFTRIKADPYNGNKSNSSYLPMVYGLSSLTATFAAFKLLNFKEVGYLFIIPLVASNSHIYIPLQGNIYKKHNDFPEKYRFNVGPFIKNETDYFTGRKNKWGQLAPGCGIRLYSFYDKYSSEIGIECGVQRTFQIDFKGSENCYNGYYLRFGINSNVP